MTIATDPGRESKAVLIPRLIKMELNDKLRRIKIAVGIRKQFDVLPEAWAIPDSELAKAASSLAAELSSPMLFAHVHRTYCFGAILAERSGMKFDRELAYVSAVLHDLGLTDSLAERKGSFEWVGAQEAREFCEQHRLPPLKCDLVHDAIALHSSIDAVRKREEPEVGLVHYGAALDLMGLRVDEIPKQDLDTILEQYSRQSFKCEFGGCLKNQAALKPNSHIAGGVSLGITDRIKDQL